MYSLKGEEMAKKNELNMENATVYPIEAEPTVQCVRVVKSTRPRFFEVKGERKIRSLPGDVFHGEAAQWLWRHFREFVEVFPKK